MYYYHKAERKTLNRFARRHERSYLVLRSNFSGASLKELSRIEDIAIDEARNTVVLKTSGRGKKQRLSETLVFIISIMPQCEIDIYFNAKRSYPDFKYKPRGITV